MTDICGNKITKYIRLIGDFPGYPEDGIQYDFEFSEDGMKHAKEMYEKNKKEYRCRVEIVEEIDIENDNCGKHDHE